MSNICTAIAQRRVVGSATKKTVLMYMADRASDDGSGIWTSKMHIAADTELSRRAVQNVISELERDGVVKNVGRKKCQNGFTYEYAIEISVLESLPDTRKSRGAGNSHVQDVHMSCAGGARQDVQEVHINHPLTTQEPSKARERADDLFTAESQPCEKDGTPDLIKEGFEEFWSDIWPSHKRKTGKVDCRKVYEQACTGKHPKAEKISPADLNAATRRYIASVKDREFLKGALLWLRQPGWEPFMGASAPGKPLTYAQKVLAARGSGRVV